MTTSKQTLRSPSSSQRYLKAPVALTLPLIVLFMPFVEKQQSFALVGINGSMTGDLTFGSTCFMMHTQTGFDGKIACDYSLTTQMMPIDPYPAVATEVDRAFYVQFSGKKQVRSFYGDIPSGPGCLVDVFVVSNLSQVTRGDSRYLCLAGIRPEGVFNCQFTMKGNYFVLLPLANQQPAKLILREVHVWARQDIAQAGSVDLISTTEIYNSSNGDLTLATMQSLLGASSVPSNYSVYISYCPGAISFNLGSIKTIENVWVKLANNSFVNLFYVDLSFAMTGPPQNVNSQNCKPIVFTGEDGEELYYTTVAGSAQYITLNRSYDTTICGFQSPYIGCGVNLRKFAVFGPDTCNSPISSTTLTTPLSSYTDMLYDGNPLSIPWPNYSVVPVNCFGLENLQYKDTNNNNLVASGVVVIDWVAKTITYQRSAGTDESIKMYAVFNSPTSFVDAGTTITFNLCTFSTILTHSLPTPTNYQIENAFPNKVTVMTFGVHADTFSISKNNPMFCGNRSYQTNVSWAGVKKPADQATGTFELWINTNDDMLAGNWTLQLTIGLKDYPLFILPLVEQINVKLLHPCMITQFIKPTLVAMETIVGEAPIVQTFNQFQDTEALIFQKGQNFCGERSYQLAGNGLFLSLQTPQDPWRQDFVLALSTSREEDAGEYNVKLRVSLIDYPYIKDKVQVKIIIKKRYLLFVPPVRSPIVVFKTIEPQEWTFSLPGIAKEKPTDKVIIAAEGEPIAMNLLTLEGNQLKIKDISVVPAGARTFTLILDDSRLKNTFNVLMLIFESKPEVEPLSSDEFCTYDIQPPRAVANLTYLSGSSPIMVSWRKFEVKTSGTCLPSKPIIDIFTTWDDSRFKQDSDWLHFEQEDINNENETNVVSISSKALTGEDFHAAVKVTATLKGSSASFDFDVIIKPSEKNELTSSRVPVMSLASVSDTGIATLRFDVPIIPFDQPEDIFMQDPTRFLHFVLVKHPLSAYIDDPNYIESGQIENVGVLSFKAREIELQLVFSNPLFISLDPFHRDRLHVRIEDESSFISAVDFKTRAIRNNTSSIELWRQIDQKKKKAVDLASKTFLSINILSSSSFAINLLLGLSLKYLWGIVNVLQFVMYMDKWKVNWAPNARDVLSKIRMIALGEFIDTKVLQDRVLDYFGLLKAQKAEGRQLSVVQAAVIGPRYDRIAVASLLTVGFVLLIAIIITCLLKSKFKEKFIQMATKTKQALVWNGFIRYYLQSFLKSTFRIAIVFQSIATTTNKPSVFKITISSIETFLLFVITPILIYKALKKHQPNLEQLQVKQLIGSLYLGVRTKEIQSLFYVFEFLIFRLLYVVLTTALINYPGLQVNIFMFLNNLNIIYLGLVEPFDTKSQQTLELTNFFLLNTVGYCVLLLANLMTSPEHEYKVCWSVIALVGLIFIINFAVVLTEIIKKLITVFKTWRHKRSMAKLHEQRQQEKANSLAIIKAEVEDKLPQFEADSESVRQSKPLPLKQATPLKKPTLDDAQAEIEKRKRVEQSLSRIDEINSKAFEVADSHPSDEVFVSSVDSDSLQVELVHDFKIPKQPQSTASVTENKMNKEPKMGLLIPAKPKFTLLSKTTVMNTPSYSPQSALKPLAPKTIGQTTVSNSPSYSQAFKSKASVGMNMPAQSLSTIFNAPSSQPKLFSTVKPEAVREMKPEEVIDEIVARHKLRAKQINEFSQWFQSKVQHNESKRDL